MFIYPYVYLSLCSSVSMFIYPYVYLSLSGSISISISIYIYLSIYNIGWSTMTRESTGNTFYSCPEANWRWITVWIGWFCGENRKVCEISCQSDVPTEQDRSRCLCSDGSRSPLDFKAFDPVQKQNPTFQEENYHKIIASQVLKYRVFTRAGCCTWKPPKIIPDRRAMPVHHLVGGFHLSNKITNWVSHWVGIFPMFLLAFFLVFQRGEQLLLHPGWDLCGPLSQFRRFFQPKINCKMGIWTTGNGEIVERDNHFRGCT